MDTERVNAKVIAHFKAGYVSETLKLVTIMSKSSAVTSSFLFSTYLEFMSIDLRAVCTLRIDTGDTAWYVMVAIKKLPLNSCSRYKAMLKRIWT